MSRFLPALSIIALTLLIFFVLRQQPLLFPNELSVSELRVAIADGIKTHGAATTYAAFKEQQAGKDFDESHSALHLFGEVLFDEEGTDGIAICDEDYNYGCFHGLVTAAIRASGLETVAPLDASCARIGARGAAVCQHGIGHGILEYVGHAKLREALEACALTHQPDPLAGCTGGVFMEYNVPRTLTEDGRYVVAPRPLADPANPYAPCDTLQGTRFEQGCYQELAQWWHQVYPEDYARMGGFCAALTDVKNKNACVNGIGKIIPSVAAYDVTRARELCEKVGTDESYVACIVQASWSFESNTGNHTEAVELCSFVPTSERHRCPS